ncbi:hypothetical protein B0H13DRAFT_2295414 [Mycena leptocephala]|nr:hypothetical protein B0H13DRAFT_2295414 [Mycena leptocephala]
MGSSNPRPNPESSNPLPNPGWRFTPWGKASVTGSDHSAVRGWLSQDIIERRGEERMQTKEERKNTNGKDSHQRQRNNGKTSEFRGRNESYHFGLQTETENLSDIQPWAQSTVWTLLLIDTTQCAELRELRASRLACARQEHDQQRVNQSRGAHGDTARGSNRLNQSHERRATCVAGLLGRCSGGGSVTPRAGELGQRAAGGGSDWMEGMKRVQDGSGVGRLEWCNSTYQRTSLISSSPDPRGVRVSAEVGWDRQGMSGEDMRARTRTWGPVPQKHHHQRPINRHPHARQHLSQQLLLRLPIWRRKHGRGEQRADAAEGREDAPILLEDPPAAAVDAQRGGGGGARTEDQQAGNRSAFKFGVRGRIGGTCGGDAAAELKKKELETEGKEETEEPEAERDGLSGGDGVGERDGEDCRVWRVRIVSAPVLIDPASIAVGDNDKMGHVGREIRSWRC